MAPRIQHKWACTFEDGAPVPDNPTGLKMECLGMEGKRGYVSVQLYRRTKSNEQNRYYRGVVVQRFADYWGCANEEAHGALSFEHLAVHSDNPEMPAYVKSTRLSEWDTGMWERYMDFLRRWGMEKFNIRIELPNEVDFDAMPDVYF